MTAILSPLGWLYGKAADARNALFERGALRSHSLGARTISIGNMTAGGTGKTPLVASVAEILADEGEKVCILTRGYGRKDPGERVLVSDGERVLADATTGGDEPVELASKLIGKAIVLADADRVAAASWAKNKFGITTFVLDDGFQHRRAKRDLDIVCIDATNPFGGGKVLPAGLLREPAGNLRRADVVVVTRANLSGDIADLRQQISELSPQARVFLCENSITGLRPIDSSGAETHQPRRTYIEAADTVASFAFCGLGNPDGFFLELRRQGFDIRGTRAFADHYFYQQSDVAEIERLARGHEAERLLTTAKDAVKLSNLNFEVSCFAVEAEPHLDRPEEFRRIISQHAAC